MARRSEIRIDLELRKAGAGQMKVVDLHLRWLAHTLEYGQYGSMKTTLDIQDALLERAKRHAKRVRQPLRAIVEEGLRRVLSADDAREAYQLPDRSVGDASASDPLESLSWQDLRGIIYGEPSSR